MKLTQSQLNRAIYSAWDFQQALSALEFLLQEWEPEKAPDTIQLRRLRCYETAMIVAFCRPFEGSRGRSSLGLRALGISLNEDEKVLKERLLHLRRKVIAHSDDEEMHFRSDTHEVAQGVCVPHLQFNERLTFCYDDLRELELLFRRLRQAINEFFFEAAQMEPELFNTLTIPDSLLPSEKTDA